MLHFPLSSTTYILINVFEIWTLFYLDLKNNNVFSHQVIQRGNYFRDDQASTVHLGFFSPGLSALKQFLSLLVAPSKEI